MADNSMTFSNTLMQLGGEDFLRELTEFMLNRIMEADVTRRINAEPHERSECLLGCLDLLFPYFIRLHTMRGFPLRSSRTSVSVYPSSPSRRRICPAERS